MLDSVVRALPEAATSPAILQGQHAVYVARGFRDSAAAIAAQLSASPAIPVRLTGLQRQAGQATIAGRLSRSISINDEISGLLTERGGTRFDGLGEATADILFRGRPAQGVQRIDAVVAGRQWAAASAEDRPYLWVANLYALAGRVDRARQQLARYQAEDPAARAPTNAQSVTALNGEIALAEKNSAEALRQFRAADLEEDGAPTGCEACTSFNLARAFDLAGQPDSTLAYYERYLDVPAPRRPDWRSLAQVQKRLGELYDSRNERKKAIQHYAAFVEQWKDADSELQPVVATVKRRLNELRGQEGE